MKDKLLTKIFMTAFQKAKSNPEDVKVEAVRKLHTIIYFLLFSITRVGQCEPLFFVEDGLCKNWKGRFQCWCRIGGHITKREKE